MRHACACLFALALVGAGLATAAHASKPIPRACMTAQEAADHPNAEVCVTAHVYNVVELNDGTRFLDICPANTPDANCGFVVMSLADDRREVGPLKQYRDMDVKLRGIVRPMHGRMGIVISHVRQFSGGPEKFKPNPRLLHGFNPAEETMPVRDPNLTGSGHARTFMNNHEKTAAK